MMSLYLDTWYCTTYATITWCGAFRVHNVNSGVRDTCTTHGDYRPVRAHSGSSQLSWFWSNVGKKSLTFMIPINSATVPYDKNMHNHTYSTVVLKKKTIK